MIGTIRKHQTWLWGLIITATVVSFVIYFTPTSRMSGFRDRSEGSYGTINGRVIAQEEFADSYRETRLYFLFNTGDWPDKSGRRFGLDLDRETRNRLLLIEKLKDLNVQVSDEA